MASLRTSAVQTALREAKQPYVCPFCELRRMGMGYRPPVRRYIRHSSTTSTASDTPPLISKFRQDLKTAMRAKDTPRLNVLRAVLAEYTNASKTKNPITNDLQMWTLLKKRQASSVEAAKEADEQKRDDLASKARGEADIVGQYAELVDRMSGEEIKQTLTSLIADLKGDGEVTLAKVINAAFKEDGPFTGKAVQKDWVVKEAIPMLKAAS